MLASTGSILLTDCSWLLSDVPNLSRTSWRRWWEMRQEAMTSQSKIKGEDHGSRLGGIFFFFPVKTTRTWEEWGDDTDFALRKEWPELGKEKISTIKSKDAVVENLAFCCSSDKWPLDLYWMGSLEGLCMSDSSCHSSKDWTETHRDIELLASHISVNLGVPRLDTGIAPQVFYQISREWENRNTGRRALHPNCLMKLQGIGN